MYQSANDVFATKTFPFRCRNIPFQSSRVVRFSRFFILEKTVLSNRCLHGIAALFGA